MAYPYPPPPARTDDDLIKIIESKGGLFQLIGDHNPQTVKIFEVVHSQFTRIISYAIEQLYNIQKRDITYGIISGSCFNAFAYASKNEENYPFDFIGINVGTIFTIMDIFSRLLSHPGNFKNIGNVNLESGERAIVPHFSTDVYLSKFSSCYPDCPTRNLFSNILFQTALNYLFFHELTHLKNGHLEYLRNEFSHSFWQEAMGTGHNKISPIINQTLEMDADCGAILLTLNDSLNFMKRLEASTPRKNYEEQHNSLKEFFADEQAITRIVSFSSYIIFRLFDFKDWDINQQPYQTHPQPPVRMGWINETLYEIFRTRPIYKYDCNLFAQNSANIILEAEQCCANIKLTSVDPRGILSIYTTKSKIYLNYLSSLKTTWRTIRPQLEKYKRGGNLAN